MHMFDLADEDSTDTIDIKTLMQYIYVLSCYTIQKSYNFGMSYINNLGDRQQLLLKQLLHNKLGLSIDELSKLLDISRNAVVQHLNALSLLGYITSDARQSTGGRPSKVYRLTQEGRELFPRHYALFSEVLLQLIQNEWGDLTLTSLMKTLGNTLAEKYSDQINSKASLSEKITIINEIMFELGYETRPVNPSTSNTITADNCVFHQIAEKSEAVCQLDIELLKQLSGAEIEHTECMVRGGSCCKFRLSDH